MEIVMAKLETIQPSTFNPRKNFDESKLKELAASIKEKGLINPITVRHAGKKLEIICGERRFRAMQIAGFKDIPVFIKDLDDKQALELMVIENLQRDDVHPLEEAEGYEQLMQKHGYKTVDDIAIKVGKSKAYVYARLKLCDLIHENRKLFYEGKFSPSTALLVSRIPVGLQKEAGIKVAKGEYSGDKEPMSYRKAQLYIHEHFMLQLKEAPFDPKDKTLCEKSGPCTICIKRTGNQKELFPDVSSADVCTDPECFASKKSAHIQRTVAKLKASGKEIVSPEEAKKLFQYENDTTPDYKYMALDEHDYSWPSDLTVRKMLKDNKDTKIVYAIQPYSGKIIEMVERTDLPKILKNAGVKVGGDGVTTRASDLGKAKTENRIREAKRGFWIGKVSSTKDARCMNVVTLYILLKDIGYMDAEKFMEAAKVKDWTIEKIYNLGDKEVCALIDKAIARKAEYLGDDELEFLSTKLNFSMVKDYVITGDYLDAMTKDELAKLIKELGIDKVKDPLNLITDMSKKSSLVNFILTHAPKSKVPKELTK